MSRYVSFALLLCVIILLGIVFYRVMVGFIVPLFLAALLVVMFRPVHAWMVDKCRNKKYELTPWREKLAAMLSTLAIGMIVIVPLVVLIIMAIGEARDFVNATSPNLILQKVRDARRGLGLEADGAEQIRRIQGRFTELMETMKTEELGYHQSELMFIEDDAMELARLYGLDTPATDPPSADSRRETWDPFMALLAEARQLNRDANPSLGPPDGEIFHDYQLKVAEAAQHFRSVKDSLVGAGLIGRVKDLVNPSESEVMKYGLMVRDFASEKILKIGSASTSFLVSFGIGTFIMILGIYFFFIDGPSMVESVKGLSPLDDEHEQELIEEFAKVSRAVVVATLASAVVQGLLAGIGFYFVGIKSVFLLTLLTTCLALVPFVGAAAVWVPVALSLWLIEGNMTAAIGLAIYGVLVISMADNVIKPLILHGQSNLHPLVALLSVLGGVAALGPIGILVGPMVVAFLQTLLKILQRELNLMDSPGSPSAANQPSNGSNGEPSQGRPATSS